MESLKKGDAVRWESSSAGVTKSKRGQIIVVVPEGNDPLDVIAREAKTITAIFEFDGGTLLFESLKVSLPDGTERWIMDLGGDLS